MKQWRKLKYTIPFIGIMLVYQDTQDLAPTFIAIALHGIYFLLLINGLVWLLK